MAIFNNMSITNKGQVLYAKAQAGQELHFTKMMVGSGQIENRNPATLIALIEPKFDIGIQQITPNTELKTATISGTINNSGVTEATYICEIGLFAEDPDDGEILYAYGTAGQYGDYYAPESMGPFSWNYQINAAIGNAANVTVELSNLTYDYGVFNTNTTFLVISGGNQKEINKSIDKKLSEITTQQNNMMYEEAGGTATAITLNMPATLKYGYWKKFIASGDNNGAATTINGKPLYKVCSTNPPNLKKDRPYEAYYNATNDCFFLKASATGTATPAQVLADVPFSNENDTDLVGTMPKRGAPTANLNCGGTYNIQPGYYSGGKVTANSLTSQTSATATAAQILSGYSAWVNGVKIDGNATIKSLGGAEMYKYENYTTISGTGSATINIPYAMDIVLIYAKGTTGSFKCLYSCMLNDRLLVGIESTYGSSSYRGYSISKLSNTSFKITTGGSVNYTIDVYGFKL